MKFIDTLASYLPSLIVHHLVENESNPQHTAPTRQSYETVCLFCDVSGFTALAEAMERNGQGAEGLATHLNSYFGLMCRLIAADGGDVFKFAGDACIVLWPDTDDMHTRVLRATQCAWSIQKYLNAADLDKDNNVQLSVKCGIGMGMVSVLHIGGVLNRMEYLAVGEPLLQAFQAEHHAVSGQIILSKDAWGLISTEFTPEHTFDDDYVRLDMSVPTKSHVKKKNMTAMLHSEDMEDSNIEFKIKQYITGAVLPNLNPEAPDDEKWGNELRKVCVMFVNLGIKEQQLLAAARYDEAMKDVHEVLCEVQRSVYQYEGAINKFLMDDKGSTLIACFGLPPGAHEDNCERGVLAALKICQVLYSKGLSASCGLTYGQVFCGIIGTRVRREYSVLGDCVNLSARLMQRATGEGGGVIVDSSVVDSCGAGLLFTDLDSITVKGKSIPVDIFRPYPTDTKKYPIPAPASHGGPNLYTSIYMAQKEYYTAYHTLSFLQAYLRHNNIREKNRKNKMMQIERLGITRREKSMAGGTSAFAPGSASSDRSSLQSDGSKSKYRNQDSSPLLGSPPSFSESTSVSGRSTPGASSRRNSTLNLKASLNLASFPASSSNIEQKTPRIMRPTLTPSGLVPIHHAASQSFGFDRLSSVIDEHGDEDSDDSGDSGSADCPRPMSGSVTTHGVNRPQDMYQIVITIPHEQRITNLRVDSPTLPAIGLAEATDLHSLLARAKQLAVSCNLLTPEEAASKLVFNILGSRSFLPHENFDMRYLPAFIACAFDSDLGEEELEAAVGRQSCNSQFSFSETIPPTRDRKMSCLGGGVKKTLELTLIKEIEKLNVQSRLCVVKRRLLQKKIRLVDEGRGGVCVIEGEPGCGKTEVLANFVARVLPNTAAVYFTHGAAFCGHVTAFGVWGVVVQQYLDLLVAQRAVKEGNEGTPPAAPSVEGRTAMLTAELENSFIDDDEDNSRHKWLLSYTYLINELCAVTVAVPEERLDDLPGNTSKVKLIVKALLFRLVRRLASHKSSIIILDDAQHLSHDSWALALALTNIITQRESSSNPVKLLLIFSLRPVVNYRSRYETISPDYEALVETDHIMFLKLDGMPPEEAEDFICSKLGSNVESISDDLFQLLEERAMGNPFVAMELISALQTTEGALVYEHVSGKNATADDDEAEDEGSGRGSFMGLGVSFPGTSTRSNSNPAALAVKEEFVVRVSLAKDFNLADVPPVKKVQALLCARLDRLNACQQGILKVASVIARFQDPTNLTFKWSALTNIYPIDGHKDHLWREVISLEDNGVLMLTSQGKDVNPLNGKADYEFRFSYAAMCDCVLSRMLKDHRVSLLDATEKYESVLEKAKRQEHMSKMAMAMKGVSGRTSVEDSSLSFLSGILHIQRRTTTSFLTMKVKRRIQTGGEWKDRYCVLKPDALYLYREQEDVAKGVATQIIWLDGAKCEVEKKSEQTFQEKHVIRVEANKWAKNGKKTESRRTFVIAATSKENMTNWVYMVRYVIESLEAASGKDPKVKGRQKRAMSRRSLTAEQVNKATFKSPAQGGIDADDPQTLEGEGDFRLVISVQKGANLINPEAFGTSNPYCVLKLDDQHCRTSTPKLASVDPIWGENFVFPLEKEQWVKSTLRVQVWNRDAYLSDDFLGYVDLELSSLEPEDLPVDGHDIKIPGERVSDVGEDGERGSELHAKGTGMWMKLVPKKKYEDARGELNIHAWLLMPSETQMLCEEEGGVAEFKKALLTKVLEAQLKGDSKDRGHEEKMNEDRRRISSITFSDLLEGVEERHLSMRGGEIEQEKIKAQKVEELEEAEAKEEMEKNEQEEIERNEKDARLSVSFASKQQLPYIQERVRKAAARDSYTQKALDQMDLEDVGEGKASASRSKRRHHSVFEPMDTSREGIAAGKKIEDVTSGIEQKLNGLIGDLGGKGGHVLGELQQILANVKGLRALEGAVTKDLRRSSLTSEAADAQNLLHLQAGGMLDAKDKKWLEANYTRDGHEEENGLVNASSPTSESGGGIARSRGSSSRGSVSGKNRSAPGRSPQSYSGSAKGDGDLRATSPFDSMTEAFMNSIIVGMGEGEGDEGEKEQGDKIKFRYKDAKGKVQGPFGAKDMLAWYEAGLMHEQVMVCMGYEEGVDHFMPFAMFIETLKNHYGGDDEGGVSWASHSNSSLFSDDMLFKDPVDVTKQFWKWDFDVFKFRESELCLLAVSIVESLNIPGVFKVPQSAFESFMDNVRHLMTRNDLPYHNYYHALDVMQTCFVFVEEMEASQFVTELEVFGLMIAAVCHDLDHPGLGNSYQVNKGTAVALRFNDASCLENMHAYLCFDIMRKNGCDIMSGLDNGDRVAMRKQIIGGIISTDMTFHFGLKNELNGVIERLEGEAGFLKTEKDREVLLKTLIHVADISNPCKPWDLSKEWSDRVIKEFFHQGDLEKAEGMKISVGMDRETVEQSSLSLNFCDFIVAPFFVSLVNLCGKMGRCVEMMSENRGLWDVLCRESAESKLECCEEGEAGEEARGKYREELDRWKLRAEGFDASVKGILEVRRGGAEGEGSGGDEK